MQVNLSACVKAVRNVKVGLFRGWLLAKAPEKATKSGFTAEIHNMRRGLKKCSPQRYFRVKPESQDCLSAYGPQPIGQLLPQPTLSLTLKLQGLLVRRVAFPHFTEGTAGLISQLTTRELVVR